MDDRGLYTGLIRLHVLHHAAEGPIFGQAMIDELAGRMVEVFGPLQSGDAVAARGTDEIQAGTEVRGREMKPPTS